MSKARYVKYNVTAINYGDPYCIFSEVEVYDASNNKIAINSANITAPTSVAGYTKDKMVDGSTSSAYIANVLAPLNVIIDLGQSYDITKIRRYAGSHGGYIGSYNPKNYTIQFSDDNVNYTTATTAVNETNYDTWVEKTYPLSLTTKYLFEVNSSLNAYKFDGSDLVDTGVLIANLVKADFITHGINSPSVIPANKIPTSFKVLKGTDDLAVSTNKVKLTAIPTGKLLVPIAYKALPSSLKEINGMSITENITGIGVIKTVVSFNGINYKTWNGTAFVDCPLTATDVKTNGMTKAILEARIKAEWEGIRGDSKQIWVSHYIEMGAITDTANIDLNAISYNENGYYRSLTNIEEGQHPIVYNKNSNNLFDSASVINNSGTTEELVITSLSFTTASSNKFKTISVVGQSDINPTVENDILNFSSGDNSVKIETDSNLKQIKFKVDTANVQEVPNKRFVSDTQLASLTNSGLANGLATLDGTGKVPSSQLPSYVDDILDFPNTGSFPITGETGKLYLDKTSNSLYRWTGSTYASVSSASGGIVLGTTSTTATRGDYGTAAYNHSLATGNLHGTTKSDIGLGNVDNTSDANKPISAAVQTALNLKQNKINVVTVKPTTGTPGEFYFVKI